MPYFGIMSAIHGLFSEIIKQDASISEVLMNSSDYWVPDKKSSHLDEENSFFLGKSHLFNLANSKDDVVFKDETTGCCIAANVRLDNREELLQLLSINNKQISNSELVLRAYLQWKSECVQHLYGDFAFILWDAAHKKVFAARDHFGIKLLMYSLRDKGILLSNEPSVFIHSNWIKPKVKESWIINRLLPLRNSTVEIAYENLHFLPPAHYLEWSLDGFKKVRYWELENHKQYEKLGKEELLLQFKELFKKAIKSRLESQYPISCQLSEGLDSNGITGYAAKLLENEKIYTFSYQSVELNESTKPIWEKTYQDIEEMLALHSNLEPKWSNDPKLGRECLDKIMTNTRGVLALSPQFPSHLVLAKKVNSRVMLSGWGGDHCVSSPGDFYESELFAKGKWIALIRLLQQLKKRQRTDSVFRAFLRTALKQFFPKHYLRRALNSSKLAQATRLKINQSIVKTEYLNKHKVQDNALTFLNNYYKRYSTKDYSIRELFDVGVEGRIIASELSARLYKLEYRFPMLDVRLVEFAFNLPSYLKLYQGIERYHFRELLKGVTTEKIRLRQKKDVHFPNLTHSNIVDNDKLNAIKDLLETPEYHKFLKGDYLEKIEKQKNVTRFLDQVNCLKYI